MPSRSNCGQPRAGRRPKAIQKEARTDWFTGEGRIPTCDRPQKLTNSGLGYRPVRCKPGPMIPFAQFTCSPFVSSPSSFSFIFLYFSSWVRDINCRGQIRSRNPRKYSDIIAEEGSIVKTHHLRDVDDLAKNYGGRNDVYYSRWRLIRKIIPKVQYWIQ